MIPEAMVISYPLAQNLKAAGVPQDSLWAWWQHYLTEEVALMQTASVASYTQAWAAFTLSELIAVLGHQFGALTAATVGFVAHQSGARGTGVCAPTPQDALGHLVLEVWGTRS